MRKCCRSCPHLSPAPISSLQMPAFISWLLVLWLQKAHVISVPWQSDLGRSWAIASRLLTSESKNSPETSSPLRGLNPGWNLPKKSLEVSNQPFLGHSQWVMLKPGPCSTAPSSLLHFGREGWPGKALGGWDQAALEGRGCSCSQIGNAKLRPLGFTPHEQL